MSWSVNAMGKVAAVRAALAVQFANAKSGTAHIPHEQRSVVLVEEIVNDQLDFLAGTPTKVVRVEASGSAHKSADSGYSQVKLLVEPVSGFVE